MPIWNSEDKAALINRANVGLWENCALHRANRNDTL